MARSPLAEMKSTIYIHTQGNMGENEKRPSIANNYPSHTH